MDRNEKLLIYNPYARKKRKRSKEEDNGFHSFSDPSTPKRCPAAEKSYDSKPNSKAKTCDQSSIGVSAEASALIISAADKAGMQGIDRSKIDAIILRESGNSLYIQQQRRRDEKVNQRVRQLQQRLQDAHPRDYEATEDLDEMLRSYQKQQATRSTCVVVDMVSLSMCSIGLNSSRLSQLTLFFQLFLFCIGYVLHGLRTVEPSRAR